MFRDLISECKSLQRYDIRILFKAACAIFHENLRQLWSKLHSGLSESLGVAPKVLGNQEVLGKPTFNLIFNYAKLAHQTKIIVFGNNVYSEIMCTRKNEIFGYKRFHCMITLYLYGSLWAQISPVLCILI